MAGIRDFFLIGTVLGAFRYFGHNFGYGYQNRTYGSNSESSFRRARRGHQGLLSAHLSEIELIIHCNLEERRRTQSNPEMDGTDFHSLPEEFISSVLSLTSPRDTCSSASVSRIFKWASEADIVWEKFLPPNCEEILLKLTDSDSQLQFSSKKELYFRLCDPVLIEGGTKSFWLDRSTGKKCYMGNAKHILITWGSDPSPRYWSNWSWKSVPESRFSVVTRLMLVWWLDVYAKIDTYMLSPKTNYTAYLIVRFEQDFEIGSKSTESTTEVENCLSTSIVLLCPQNTYCPRWGPTPVDKDVRVAARRADGWMELELGDFYTDDRNDVEVKIKIKNINCHCSKHEVIIEGLEVRPRVQGSIQV